MPKRCRPFLTLLVALGNCYREEPTATIAADAPTQAAVHTDAAEDVAPDGMPSPSIEQLEAFLRNTFPDRVPQTSEDNRIITFVDGYLDRKNPFPRPRMLLLHSRAAHSWVVNVFALETLRRGGSGGDIAVHVSEKQGRLRVEKTTIGGY